jgi:zinc/manganese transport system substrate-binding protein
VRRAPGPIRLPRIFALLTILAAGACAAGCGAVATGSTGSEVQVVAAEDFWGSIANQLAGPRTHVQSVISNPDQDPHSYEPTAADARHLAIARLVIVNGLGYDPWVAKLLSANPTSSRIVLNVGGLLGLEDGDNPHRWYDPADVEAVANAITADLQRLDPEDSAYYSRQREAFEEHGLARYHSLIAEIRRRYAGVAVGASESVFAAQAPALGLRLITPAGLLKAVSEGTEITAQDTLTAQRQLSSHTVKVWIYNSQNATPEVQQLNALARAHGIPIATITETLFPAGVSFEHWQVAQLERIERALHEAAGR